MAVVGDSPLFRRGVAQVIGTASDLELIADARSVDEVEGRLMSGDVVVLDLQPATTYVAAVVSRLAGQGMAVLVMCSYPPTDIEPPMQAGARGCLSRQTGEEELLAAVRLIGSGGRYVSAVFALHPGSEPSSHVTDRERQILELVAHGETDHGIAVRLGISEHTVHSHLDRLRDKIGCRRRADLTRFAIDHDIIPPSSAQG